MVSVKLRRMGEIMSDVGKVEDAGAYWKLVLAEDKGRHLVSKHTDNKKKPGILTKVNVDIDSKKNVSTSISEVLYPKWRYQRDEIEKVSDAIVKSAGADCPLCQKINVAISVQEIPRIEDRLGIPKPEDMLVNPSIITEPIIDTYNSIIDAINSTVESLIMPLRK